MKKKCLQAAGVVLFLGFVLGLGWAIGKNTQTSVPVMGDSLQESSSGQASEESEEPSTPSEDYYWDDLDMLEPEFEVNEELDDHMTVRLLGALERPADGEAPELGAYYNVNSTLIGIDPGHLGYTGEKYKNVGAVSVFDTPEYEWSLQVGYALQEELNQRGYDVYMVRTTNVQKEYPYNNGHRALAMNSMECDLVVSIHWDSFSDAAVNGWHAIYKGDKESDNYLLAKAVSDAYEEALNGDIRKYSDPRNREDLWLLNVVEMPAVLLECGYSSNEKDATWLEDEENHSVIATAIADGIDHYFEMKDTNE